MRKPKPIQIAEMDLSGFWSRIDVRGEDDCWEWMGGRTSAGYGIYRKLYAHRLMAAYLIGQDIGEAHVCHSCDNPPCCNPRHLFIGTHRDNMRDAWVKGRLRLHLGWDAVRGEKNRLTKLTEADVKQIKRRHQSGERQTEIARDYPCGATAINNIIKGRNWAHVT